ncbi:hypothetical protein HMPREF0083_00167 [Aneurinibacillus aneurinilyticus ATCC 12856]|uniref:Uncharacterized protein n=1 Tax=Aneurinibacillus aneurinilyticus ATCC 12856 TaxID=649747 RepID=U1X9U1_ANEAE|nr:hypothetical protein HMPREF0083_00167 [Aneurinibacillus aneurinilyticus ATCC 12856]
MGSQMIAHCRNDFLHQLSTRLVSENQFICLEDRYPICEAISLQN